MKEPDHKVKRHIVPLSNKQKPYWIENPVHGWLGSGIKDKNGVEIFEGDIINDEGNTSVFSVVTFKDGSFWAFDQILEHFDHAVTIVGHVMTE